MVTASAPGKVYLFGEHAVVYGEPAVPCAIDLRARVTATARDDDRLRIHAEDLSLSGFTVEYSGGPEGRPDVDAPSPLVDAAMGYVEGAVAQARAVAGRPEAGVELTIESEIPLGAGIGSSAAVVVAAIAATAAELGASVEPEELARRAYAVERDVQDGEASRADTYCSAVGGAVRVEGEDTRRLDAPEGLPLAVGFDGGAGDTGELVAGVRALREEYGFARDTVAAIGDVVRTGVDALAAGDLAELGRLMDVNHGLLSALGVSGRTLDAMTWAARDAGAHGAKLTGAGGAGCVVALGGNGDHRADPDALAAALSYAPACEDAFAAPLSSAGVVVE